MKVTGLVITTTIKSRFNLLSNTIDSIERAGKGILDQKILSIDIVEGHPFQKKNFERFEKLGWFLVTGACLGKRGMANNMLRGLNNVDGDFVLYCEDDVVLHRIPTREHIEDFFGEGKMGAIVYNTHANPPWITKGVESKVSYINDRSNYFGEEEDWFLNKGMPIKDEYWICFPCAMMRTITFRGLLDYACSNCLNMGMEPGMTKAWFALGYDKWPVVMYVKKDIFECFPLDFQKLYDNANMQFWNNDPDLRHPSINDRQNTIF